MNSSDYYERKLNERGVCEIPRFLSGTEIEEYLRQADSDDWICHASTKTGKPSSLYFLPTTYRDHERVALMKMYPNAVQDWHVDGTRSTVIIHPLTDNYASGQTEFGEYEGPVILDVSRRHAVFNNEHVRICLQISFNEPAIEIWERYKSILRASS